MRLSIPLVLCLALVACSPRTTPHTTASSAATANLDAPRVATIPPEQAAFVALPNDLRERADKAGGAARKKLLSEAPDAFCAEFRKIRIFTDWHAEVKDVRTSTIDGTIDIEFDLGRSIAIEDVVQKTDPLYATVEQLQIGEAVTVSGTFTHLNHDAECGYYFGPFGVALSKVVQG